MSKYAWQDGLWTQFKGNGFKGLLKAPTGAGKTIAACKVLSLYREHYPDSVIWVAVPSRLLIEQWNGVLEDMGLDNVIVQHYASTAIRLDEFFMGTVPDATPDLLVCDEAHHLSSPTGTLWKTVLDYSIPHVLGLSATPEGAEKLIGGTILEVDWEDCNIAESISRMVVFKPTRAETDKYDDATAGMRRYRDEYNPNASFFNDMVYRNLIMRRKGIARNFKTRMDVAMDCVLENIGKRMIIFFSTKKQVNQFEKMLKKQGIECAVQVSGREEKDDFHPETGTKDIVLCINMVSQGFDDPTIEVGIMVSYDDAVGKNKQMCGRIVRARKDKVARIYYIIAQGTTDENIIKNQRDIFPPGNIRVVNYTG